jgi:two-component system phosphate regulon sensor histidine kinase PhoR
MPWFLLCLFVVSAAAFAYSMRRKWIRPWCEIEELIRQVGKAKQPRTFLVDGGPVPRRVGVALEEIFIRQVDLERQNAERESGRETILGAMQDGLLVVDAARRVTLSNRTFQQLFSLREIALGTAVSETLRDSAIDQLISNSLRTGESGREEISVLDRRLEVNAVPMKNGASATTGVVVLFHDITQLKQLDEVRKDFVANVSHELRTPLSILRGYIETLRDHPKTSAEELAGILQVMERHSKRLGLLVDDLLTLAQLESKNPNLQLDDVSLSALLNNVVRDWKQKFSEKRLNVTVDLAEDLPLLRADETRLHEILYNLLDNAVKYSRAGGAIRLQAKQRGHDMVLSVGDTGVGIGKDDLPRIFERFYRVDKARSRELGGTGLGLAIVKHIAQLHGGRVEAESEPERGTTIHVILPIVARTRHEGTGSVPSGKSDDTEVVPPTAEDRAVVTQT